MITVNGEKREGMEGINASELLKRCDYDSATVVVECNEEIIPRENLSEYIVKDGDTIEVIHFVGGGA